jgi:hypothetical protein
LRQINFALRSKKAGGPKRPPSPGTSRQLELLAGPSVEEIAAVSGVVFCEAATTNTTAASVKTTANVISRTDRRARSAKGPDCSFLIIMSANLCIRKSEIQSFERRATEGHSVYVQA